MNDSIQFEVLEDGTISIITDEISKDNHRSADEFLNEVFGALGGEVTKQKRDPIVEKKAVRRRFA